MTGTAELNEVMTILRNKEVTSGGGESKAKKIPSSVPATTAGFFLY